MTCPSEEEIESSLDGAPVARGASPIEAHLDECPRCRARAARIESIDAALAAGLLAWRAPVGRAGEDPRRIAPRLKSRLVAIGDEELARRAEAQASTASGRLRATTRLQDARRRRAAGRVRRDTRSFATLAIAAGALAMAGGALLYGLFAGRGPEPVERGSVAKLPELHLGLPAAPESAPAAPEPSRPSAQPRPASAPRLREAFEEGSGPLERPDLPAATTLADLPPHVDREAAPAPAPAPLLARAEPAPAIDAAPAAASASLAPAGPSGEYAPIEIAYVRGDLRVRKGRGTGYTRVGTPRLDIAAGDVLRAEKPGAVVAFGRGAELFIRPGTEVSLSPRQDRGGFQVAVEVGEVLAEVAPGIAGNTLSLRSLVAAVELDGGRVGFQASKGVAKAFVLEGAAKMTNNAGEVAVARGEAASALAGSAPVAKRLAEADAAGFAFAERLRPRRTAIFQANFERGAGPFDGAVVRAGAGAPGPCALELRPLKGDAHFGERATARRSGLFRARPGTEIRFSYFLPEPGPIVVQAANDAAHETFRATLADPVVGRWTSAAIFVDELAAQGEGGRRVAAEGDVFSSLEFLAGRPNAPARLLLDRIVIFERE
jgi:hypothetical protein